MGARVRYRRDLRTPQYEINVTWRGQRVRRLVGGNERRAQREASDVLRRMKAGERVSGHTPASTIATYGAEWIAQLENRTAEDDRRLFRLHIEPRMGALRLDQLDELHVRAFVDAMASEPLASTGNPPKARTVRNAHSVLSRMLSDAVAERLIPHNPATAERIGRKALPRAGRNRKSPGPREHLAALLECTAIPLDRRVLYALQYLTGTRIGETVARCWQDLDLEAPGLWALHVHDQYDGRPLKTEADDDGEDVRARVVPVHPALRAVLEHWRAEGWLALYGRAPEPGDLIVPDRKTGRARTKNQAIKARYRDLAAAGLLEEATERHWRGTHTGRRWLITYARSDGAPADMLERVTHNAVGAMIDRYTWADWPSLCRAVLALRAEAPSWACHVFCHDEETEGEIVNDSDMLPGGGAGSRTRARSGGTAAFRGLTRSALGSVTAAIRRDPRVLVQIATHVADSMGAGQRADVKAALELLATALGRASGERRVG